MNKRILAITIVMGASSPAMAQSAFQGFYGQLSTGYENNTASGLSSPLVASNGILTETFANFSASDKSFGGAPLIAGVGYNFSLSPKWLLGVGADYSLFTQESSRYNYSVVGGGVGDVSADGAKIKVSNRLNIFIAPSYAISEERLVYFKAGYSSVRANHTAPGSISLDGEPLSLDGFGVGSNQSKNLNGYILGLGYKQIINGGFYAFSEANYMNYGSQKFGYERTDGNITFKTSANGRLDSYQVLVGVGYKF
jgi:hypothetical protein